MGSACLCFFPLRHVQASMHASFGGEQGLAQAALAIWPGPAHLKGSKDSSASFVSGASCGSAQAM